MKSWSRFTPWSFISQLHSLSLYSKLQAVKIYIQLHTRCTTASQLEIYSKLQIVKLYIQASNLKSLHSGFTYATLHTRFTPFSSFTPWKFTFYLPALKFRTHLLHLKLKILASHLVSDSHPETLHSRYIHWNFTIQHPTFNIINHFHILNFVFQLFTWKVYLSNLSNFAFQIPTLRHSSIFTTENFIFQLCTSKLCIPVAYPKNLYSSSIPWDFTTLPHKTLYSSFTP